MELHNNLAPYCDPERSHSSYPSYRSPFYKYRESVRLGFGSAGVWRNMLSALSYGPTPFIFGTSSASKSFKQMKTNSQKYKNTNKELFTEYTEDKYKENKNKKYKNADNKAFQKFSEIHEVTVKRWIEEYDSFTDPRFQFLGLGF